MRHYTLYIYRIALTCLFLAAGTGSVVGQRVASIADATPNNTITDVLYVKPNVVKDVLIQKDGEDTGFDGYVRWFLLDKNDKIVPISDNNNRLNVRNSSNSSLDFLSNSYYWRSTGGNISGSTASINCRFAENDITNGIKLVYDASSVQPTVNNNGELTPHIGIRHIYELRNANDRAQELTTKNSNLSNYIGNDDRMKKIIELLDLDDEVKSEYVLNAYDIYIPEGRKINFRLPENLDNYYVGNNVDEAQRVRWTIYTTSNEKTWTLHSQTNTTSNILKKQKFDTDVKRVCILAEVTSSTSNYNATYYPVSLLNVRVMDYAEPMTADKLKEKYEQRDLNYLDRIEEYVEANSKLYEPLEYISFEKEDERTVPDGYTSWYNYLNTNKIQNLREDPIDELKKSSYYAFADPTEYQKRRNNSLKVRKGEYALYRTLNYNGISSSYDHISGNTGVYDDHFITSAYRRTVTDRLWEKTEGDQSGYFMYIDASEVPGVITKIPIGQLCANTSLIVNAWICDVSQQSNTWGEDENWVHANVGFTLKKVNTGGSETILAKYYSGELDPVPNTMGSSGRPSSNREDRAKWQQVSFKFSFADNISEDDNFILEISSNCEGSMGADFGIDEISVFKTLPNISVQRADACTASELIVSSDYRTLLRNMGWDINGGDVLSGVDLTKKYNRKYRYGLMGGDPYTNDPQNYVGNIYFGFTDKFGVNGAGANLEDWITINKDLEHKEDPVLQGLCKNIRVAIATNEEFGNMLPTNEEDAISDEVLMNIRAMNDFLSDTGEKDITGPDGGTSQMTIWSEADLEDFGDPGENDIEQLPNVIKQLLGEDLYTIPNGKKAGTIEVTDANREAFKARVKLIKDETSEEHKLYELWLDKLYSFLKIPRIRCPWLTVGNVNILNLSSINVKDTDLKFNGEIIGFDNDGDTLIRADGKYEVILFSAAQVAGGNDDIEDGEVHQSVVYFNDLCLLHSPFTVQPSITIALDGVTQPNDYTCLNSIHTLQADLWVNEVDEWGNLGENVKFNEQFEGEDYTFDWFLGTDEEYQKVTQRLRGTYSGRSDDNFANLLSAIRGTLNDEYGPLTAEIIRGSVFYKNASEAGKHDAELVIELRGDGDSEPKLVSGKEVTIRWASDILAIPYVQEFEQEGKTFSICTEPQRFTLGGNSAVPGMAVGYNNVSYDDVQLNEVPLRLGLQNIQEDQQLKKIPIQGGKITFGMSGTQLGISPGNTNVLLRLEDDTYEPVATLDELSAARTQGGTLTLTFNEDAYQHFEEGETYRLYIPFGEYDDTGFIEGSCEGYAVLVIKVVPEYLTWDPQSNNTVWYNDKNWYASTQEELYSTTTGEDEDDTKQLAPLYFTKVTIPNNKVLSLENIKTEDNVLSLDENQEPLAESIQYDMAVKNEEGEISPYYINKVSQIYFKPNAKLVYQHYLDYEKAWVEFEMSNGAKRWFASPLQGVYAGDFYAPKNTGRQETEAFAEIEYDANTTNSRWAPAFYQKAWNKAINYKPDADGKMTEVAAVKSNWSIEYNDVTVSYPIGKGFYLSVEEVPDNGTALVRLPKADAVADYKYETKASVLRADETDPKANSGQLAAYKNTDGKVTVKLNDLFGESEDDVTGEGSTSTKRHFLVGNPYMTYLKMKEFFDENTIFDRKYWTLSDGVVDATVVGTPDVPFGEDGAATGTVEPMEAFFVELKDDATVNDDTEITFTPDMMSATEIAEGGATTKGATATNPVITITAERGEIKSVATLSTSDRADNGYKADEDAVVLLDSELDAPMVYTVAGSLAAQVNAVKSIDNIGLGLYNDSREEVTITINGLSRSANPLYLYDAHTGKSVKMEGDSHSMTIGGDSHGRYYLRDSEPGSELDNAISIQSTRRGRVIVSAIRPVKEIKAFSLSGSQVRGFSVNSTQYGFDLPAGIYMIYASDGERERTEKVIVR